MNHREILQWHMDAGVDETTGTEAINYFALLPPALQATPQEIENIVLPTSHPATAYPAKAHPVSTRSPGKSAQTNTTNLAHTPNLHHNPSEAVEAARALANQVTTLIELETAVRDFNGCALKKTASKTVFCDGNQDSAVMIIGEAPGAQEDIQGIPFCGASGQLLDKMLAAIGLDRKTVYISNTVFWRPPGNRQPTPEETAICLPLVEKHIALVNPRLLILSGGTATTTLLQKDTAISRLRGKRYEYSNGYLKTPIQTIVTYHPSYLLRSPLQKALAWSDLLMVQAFLQN